MFLYAFDLIELDGNDLRREPLAVRKATLASLAGVAPGLRFNEHMDDTDGPLVFQHACKMGLEGIVSKRRDSPYRSGRSSDWIKSPPPALITLTIFSRRGSGGKSAAITGEYCLSCAEFVPTSSCDRAVVHPVSSPIGWVTRPERNCGASLVGTLSPGVAPGHPVARSIRHYH